MCAGRTARAVPSCDRAYTLARSPEAGSELFLTYGFLRALVNLFPYERLASALHRQLLYLMNITVVIFGGQVRLRRVVPALLRRPFENYRPMSASTARRHVCGYRDLSPNCNSHCAPWWNSRSHFAMMILLPAHTDNRAHCLHYIGRRDKGRSALQVKSTSADVCQARSRGRISETGV
jgi:hypothetical protein